MRFSFDKAACQNTRRALRKEWLLTNGLGGYASSSILYCNTRKYHGLLVVATPDGRQVLLSAMEESLTGGSKEFPISTRQHPGVLHPTGHQYLEKFTLDPWPQFTYRVGDVRLTREVLLVRGANRVLFRWTLQGPEKNHGRLPRLSLRLRPLLAYRGFHELTGANGAIRPHTDAAPGGFSIAPYEGMPALYIQAGSASVFTPQPDWFYNVVYFQERERGFPEKEDLFQPGVMDIPLPPLPEGGSVYLAVGTEEMPAARGGGAADLEAAWQAESEPRLAVHRKVHGLIGHLEKMGAQFCVKNPAGDAAVIAGYHWFDAWGRDTLIALPGLAFYGGRTQFGLDVLAQVPASMKNGLVPNMFAHQGEHAYNAADAALWYAFAVQCYLQENPDGYAWVREHAWKALKEIVAGYRKGPGNDIRVDENGLIHAGNGHTQLTWMDAMSDGKPVTPRHGSPVELNALWYNTLVFVDHLAKKFDEPDWRMGDLKPMRQSFFEHFWVARDGGYLGDVWRDGMLDQSIRPNQILAVSLPHPILEEQYRPQVVECVRNRLLTPYGLRTLAPSDPAYKGKYEGGPAERDAAYHQGTIWPWLLGQYTDGLLRVAWDTDGAAKALLDRVTPLFSDHLMDAGLGSISEIFDASPPARPNGTIAQAWSVAECLRMLIRLKRAAPGVYDAWEHKIAHRLANPVSGDTAGVCRVTMILEDESPAAKAPAARQAKRAKKKGDA